MTGRMSLVEIQKHIRDIKDFPKPGILFKDITPLLAHPLAFRSMIAHLADTIPQGTSHLVAIESRGFILGAALAQLIEKPVVLVRKPGQLPFTTLSHSYDLEYGQDTLQIHVDSLAPGDRVTIIDDVLATGGTATATEVLASETGAQILGCSFLMELTFLNGREKIKSLVQSLIQF